MQGCARQRRGLQRLVHGVVVMSVVLLGLSALLSHASAVDAAGLREAPGQSARPGSTNAPRHRTYLPLVAYQPSPPANVFGVQMYGNLNSSDPQLDLIQSAGVGWVRWPFGWRSIEPHDTTPEHYNWTATDTAFAAAKATGLKIIATMASNPSWAATYCGWPA